MALSVLHSDTAFLHRTERAHFPMRTADAGEIRTVGDRAQTSAIYLFSQITIVRRFILYFQTSNGPVSTSSQTIGLHKIFDKYRDSPAHNPDTIGVEGSMRYMADLQADLDDVATLAIAEALSSPTMGEFNRESFVQGWKTLNADTLPKQQAAVASFRTRLTTDPDFFKRVYKYTFLIARTPGQKAVALDAAIEFWRLLFSPPSVSWNTATSSWLDWWIEYLESKWKKTVNKDMWEQTLVFSQKSLQDETMSWWSEDGAWPGVLDDFVVYVNGRRGEEGKMDVE